MATTPRPPHHEVALRINLLLHTLREVERHEEDLCCLMHELRRADHMDAEVAVELGQMLDHGPFRSFADDVSALRRALALGTTTSARARRLRTRPAASRPSKTPTRRTVKPSLKQARPGTKQKGRAKPKARKR